MIELIFASTTNIILFILAELVFFVGLILLVDTILSHTKTKHFMEFINLLQEEQEDYEL